MGNYGQPKQYWASKLPKITKVATKVTTIVAKKTTVWMEISIMILLILVYEVLDYKLGGFLDLLGEVRIRCHLSDLQCLWLL